MKRLDVQAGIDAAPSGKIVSAAAAEAVLRRVMPELAALRFQHLMRIVRNDFLRELEADSGIEGCACHAILALAVLL